MTDPTTLKLRASDLRNDQTPTERMLWKCLRMRQVCGVRFLRQRVFGNYILDFFAPSIRLAIELDGGQHFDAGALRYDAARSAWLSLQGIFVLRYTNLDVAQRLEDVLNDIQSRVVRLQAHTPDATHRPPSFRKG